MVEASGAAAGFGLALDLLRPKGQLVLKSTFHGTTEINAARLVVDEISIVGSRCGRFTPALDLLKRSAIDVDSGVIETISAKGGDIVAPDDLVFDDQGNLYVTYSGPRGQALELDQALFELYRKGLISMEEALSNADSRSNLEAKINFG